MSSAVYGLFLCKAGQVVNCYVINNQQLYFNYFNPADHCCPFRSILQYTNLHKVLI
jgi:hypothetical protein